MHNVRLVLDMPKDIQNILLQYHQMLRAMLRYEAVIIPVMFSTRRPIIFSTSAEPAPPPPPEPNPFGSVILNIHPAESF
jgi:hypothetical protein